MARGFHTSPQSPVKCFCVPQLFMQKCSTTFAWKMAPVLCIRKLYATLVGFRACKRRGGGQTGWAPCLNPRHPSQNISKELETWNSHALVYTYFFCVNCEGHMPQDCGNNVVDGSHADFSNHPTRQISATTGIARLGKTWHSLIKLLVTLVHNAIWFVNRSYTTLTVRFTAYTCRRSTPRVPLMSVPKLVFCTSVPLFLSAVDMVEK